MPGMEILDSIEPQDIQSWQFMTIYLHSQLAIVTPLTASLSTSPCCMLPWPTPMKREEPPSLDPRPLAAPSFLPQYPHQCSPEAHPVSGERVPRVA